MTEKEILDFVNFAKKHSKTAINYTDLQNDTTLENLFDAIHFPSDKLEKIAHFGHKTTIASTHSEIEALKAKAADYITFSPVL